VRFSPPRLLVALASALVLFAVAPGCAETRARSQTEERVEEVRSGLLPSAPELETLLAAVPGYAMFPMVGKEPSVLRDRGLLFPSAGNVLLCELVRSSPQSTPGGAIYHELVLLDEVSLRALLASGSLDLPQEVVVLHWRPNPEQRLELPTDAPLRVTTPRGGLFFEEPLDGHRIELVD
jgi:hypothetical protein